MDGFRFSPPPGWPTPPPGWKPPKGWQPDPTWPPVPEGWSRWLPDSGPVKEPPPTPELVAPPPVAGPTEGGPQAAEEDDEIRTLRATVVEIQAQLAHVHGHAGVMGDSVVDLNDERVLQEVGIYRYHHRLEDSAEYREKLRELQQRIR